MAKKTQMQIARASLKKPARKRTPAQKAAIKSTKPARMKAKNNKTGGGGKKGPKKGSIQSYVNQAKAIWNSLNQGGETGKILSSLS